MKTIYLKKLVCLLKIPKNGRFIYFFSTCLLSTRNLVINYFVATILSSVVIGFVSKDSKILAIYIGILIVGIIIFGCIDTICGYIQSISTTKITNQIRSEVHSRILNGILLGDCDKENEYLASISFDIEAVQMLLSYLVTPIMTLISGIGAVIIMGRLNYIIIILPVSLGIFSMVMQNIINKKIKIYSQNIKDDKTMLLTYFNEDFMQGIDIKLLSLNTYIKNRFYTKIRSFIYNNNKQSILDANSFAFSEGIKNIVYLVSLFIAILLYENRKIELANILILARMTEMVFTFFININNSLGGIVRAMPHIERVLEILNISQEQKVIDEKKVIPHLVEFENVSFSYERKIIIKNLNFRVESGQILLVRGDSGSGKTTMFKSLLGFKEYHTGNIYIDGEELNDLYRTNKNAIRHSIAYMPQENMIIEGSIKENILLGIEGDITDEEMIDVSKKVGLHSYIMSLKQGYETQLNELGMELSVGQKQSIGIIRVLLKQSQILLLDEPFASMEQERADKIFKHILEVVKEKRIIAILTFHNTLKFSDKEDYILDIKL